MPNGGRPSRRRWTTTHSMSTSISTQRTVSTVAYLPRGVWAHQKDINNLLPFEWCVIIPQCVVIVVTEKPTQKLGSPDRTGSTQEEIFALKKKLEVLTSVPKNKYPYPVTASQEVGWDNAEVSATPHFRIGWLSLCVDVRSASSQVRVQQRPVQWDQVCQRLRDHDTQEPLYAQG